MSIYDIRIWFGIEKREELHLHPHNGARMHFVCDGNALRVRSAQPRALRAGAGAAEFIVMDRNTKEEIYFCALHLRGEGQGDRRLNKERTATRSAGEPVDKHIHVFRVSRCAVVSSANANAGTQCFMFVTLKVIRVSNADVYLERLFGSFGLPRLANGGHERKLTVH